MSTAYEPVNQKPCTISATVAPEPPTLVTKWMVFRDDFFEAFFQHMRIDLGGRDIGMTQHLLERAQIGSMGQQMAGEGMAQDVGRDPFRWKARRDRKFLEDLPEPRAGQMPLAGAGWKQERRPGVPVLAQVSVAHGQVIG